MALARHHDLLNLLALPVCLYFVPKDFYLPFSAGYLIGTFLLSPDIDLSHSKPSKRWKFLRFLWLPYQRLSRHRGMSHVPLLGTFLRLFYFLAVLTFTYFVLLGVATNYSPELAKLLLKVDLVGLMEDIFRREEAFYFVLGLIVSEVLHVLLDLLTSFVKKFKI